MALQLFAQLDEPLRASGRLALSGRHMLPVRAIREGRLHVYGSQGIGHQRLHPLQEMLLVRRTQQRLLHLLCLLLDLGAKLRLASPFPGPCASLRVVLFQAFDRSVSLLPHACQLLRGLGLVLCDQLLIPGLLLIRKRRCVRPQRAILRQRVRLCHHPGEDLLRHLLRCQRIVIAVRVLQRWLDGIQHLRHPKRLI